MKTYKIPNKEIEITEAELNALIAQKEGKRKMPEMGQTYWIVGDGGERVSYLWRGDGIDLYRYYQGNCYLSGGPCNIALAQKQAQNRITKYIWDNNLQLDMTPEVWPAGDIEKYSIAWHWNTDKPDYSCWYHSDHKSPLPILKSKEAFKQVKEACADDLRLFFTGEANSK